MFIRFMPPIVPAAFFGIVLGLAGLGNAWRAAHQVWQLPALVGEVLMALAAVVWALLLLLFILKWILARSDALGEAFHPVQCCFIGLAGVATMLMALAALPYSRLAADILFGIGATFTLGFALWRTGMLWQGEREHAATTPVLYLPTVAGGFVTAIVASALGFPDWGQFAFGVALFSWLAIESVLLHRLYTITTLPAALRPTLGIQLAPATVGAVAYLSVNDGVPDLAAHALVGYGLMQALLLLRLLPWIMQQPFAASYWGFTFGATALATAPIRMVGHGDTGAIARLAPILFARTSPWA
jgi:tellurite resistance protein